MIHHRSAQHLEAFLEPPRNLLGHESLAFASTTIYIPLVDTPGNTLTITFPCLELCHVFVMHQGRGTANTNHNSLPASKFNGETT